MPHDLRRCDDITPAVLSLPSLCGQSQTSEGPLSPADLHDGSVSNTTSLSSLSSFSSLSSLSSLSSVPCSKPVTPWSVPQTCDRSSLSNMDSRGGDCLSCLIPKIRPNRNPVSPYSALPASICNALAPPPAQVAMVTRSYLTSCSVAPPIQL